VVGVVGREHELSLAEGFLDSARERFSVLSLEGEPGIGKTTVWREVVRVAEERGVRVLMCRPPEAEASLTFSALADLLEPISDDVFTALSDAQRRALEVALLRADPGKAAVDRRTVGTAVRSLLGELAAAGPLLLAVDDLQWLDTTSAATLEFALRRLAPSPIGFLVSRRVQEPAPLKVDALVEPGSLTRATIGPLSVAGLHHVLSEWLGEAPARSTLVRIHQASGGNPLFALEVARVLAETGIPPPGEPLPVPADVGELVRRRIAKLPTATRDVLLAAAVLGVPSEEVIEAALGRPVVAGLEPAELQQIARLERGTVVFAHPLFAGAVYRSATSAERRAMHRRLADALEDSEARARQLALAAEGRDEEAAAVVHAAAAQAVARGAPAAAAELCELALGLTEAGGEAEPLRIIDAATYLHLAGETKRARTMLESVDSWEGWPPELHIRALHLLGEVVEYTQGPAALAAFGRGILDGSADAQTQAAGHLAISYAAMQSDAQSALDHADVALALLGRLGESADPETLASAFTVRFRAGAVLGHGLDRDLMERAMALEAGLPPECASVEPVAPVFGFWLRWFDDLDGSRELLERLVLDATANGQETSRVVGLMQLSITECVAGNLQQARELGLSAYELAKELEVRQLTKMTTSALALVAANLGEVDAARELCEELEPVASGSGGAEIDLESVVGLLELALGNIDAADTHLTAALNVFERVGFGEPGQFRVHADAAEAAVAVGDIARARGIADFLEGHGESTDHRWSLATGARVRALIAAAEGELGSALLACERALAHHDGLPMPLERARTLLVRGVIQRRARRRGDAKRSFEQALEIFEQAGARLWAERARRELDRVGLRRSSGDELTEGERRVAELAAKGLTNREVAAALYLSPKTVGANLTRIYRKLGIKSRAELGARMAERVQA
jgi:DNA-binding CsgD family transcriptional regulator